VNQVAEDECLSEIAENCFQFVTKFFEVINVSAMHIYHSALELCPTSSIIRDLYYHRRIVHLPKIFFGTPDSWEKAIAISGKDSYDGTCTWSPCGRFVAAQMGGAVEIRSQLTLELITTLHTTETTPHLTGPLAYSLDGRSIACVSDTAIIIWDIQTGGVANEIECSANNVSLVWSLDGWKICTINSEDRGAFIVHIHDAPLGTTLSSNTLLSRDTPHLWADEGFFLVMTTVRDIFQGCTIDIFKIGSTLTRIRSFTFPLAHGADITSLSPNTHRISILDDGLLRILDIQSSKCLLDQSLGCLSHNFSSDGSHFAAYSPHIVQIWKYDSSHYVFLESIGRMGLSNSSLQFSPTLSLLLGCAEGILWMWNLHELPYYTNDVGYVGVSRSWDHIVTAHVLENTVTITHPLAQNPPQFIDTNVEIEGLVITGNVLLVAGSGQLIAWLLTEDGLVDGVIGDRRVGRSDSIWSISQPTQGTEWDFEQEVEWEFQVEGQVGFIMLPGNASRVYDTETGEVLSTKEPRDLQHTGRLDKPNWGQEYLRFHSLRQCNIPPGDSWQTSEATLREGWVKDAEGKHRLWVPVEWREGWDVQDWRHDVTTHFGYLGDRHVVIKF